MTAVGQGGISLYVFQLIFKNCSKLQTNQLDQIAKSDANFESPDKLFYKKDR